VIPLTGFYFLIVLIVLGETSKKLEIDKQNERIVPFL